MKSLYFFPANVNESLELLGNKTCSNMFYLDEKLLFCLPQCGTWSPLPNTTAGTIDLFSLITGIIGLLAGVGVLVLAFLNRKK